jgi:hypothetical protein
MDISFRSESNTMEHYQSGVRSQIGYEMTAESASESLNHSPIEGKTTYVYATNQAWSNYSLNTEEI